MQHIKENDDGKINIYRAKNFYRPIGTAKKLVLFAIKKI